MNNTQKIFQLKQDIKLQLSPLINNDYCLLELPYYSNIGDVLIWQGTEEFLKILPYKCLYRCSQETYHHVDIPENVVILLQGGGNFGDIWTDHHYFRLRIIKEYPNNPIVILPQTIYYQHLGNLHIERPVFSNHKRLTICARDRFSYNLLKKFNVAKDIRLVPDMAFYISPESLSQFSIQESKDILLLKRTDKELNSEQIASFVDNSGNVDIHDWPTFEKEDEILGCLQALFCSGKKEKADKYAYEVFLPHMIEVGSKFISAYKKIYTTRLHVGILSVMLGKEVVFLDNSYGKNSQFYDAWLRDVDNVNCVSRRKTTILEHLSNWISYVPGYLFLCHVTLSVKYRLGLLK